MAVNELGVSRYTNLLQKFLGMDNTSPAPTLAPDVFPVLPVETDTPELLFLKGIKHGMSSNSIQTPAAGNSVKVVCQMLSTQFALACIDEIHIVNGSAAAQQWEHGWLAGFVTAGWNNTAETLRDNRWGALGVSPQNINALRILTRTNAAPDVFTGQEVSVPAGTTLIIKPGIVLVPDDTLVYTIQSQTLASAGAVQVYWRERSALRAELVR